VAKPTKEDKPGPGAPLGNQNNRKHETPLKLVSARVQPATDKRIKAEAAKHKDKDGKPLSKSAFLAEFLEDSFGSK
jgi:hypothetical protein